MRRILAALACSALLVTACGAPTAQPVASLPPLSLLPSADPYHSAVVATRAMGTGNAVIDVAYGPDAGGGRLHAQGPTVFTTGYARLAWTGSAGSFDELVSDRGIFVTSDGLHWTQWSAEDPTSTSGFADTFRGLDTLHDVTAVGAEDVAGARTTRYSGWLPVDSADAALLGLPSTSIDTATREQVDVWIDDFGHVVKVHRRVQGADGTDLVSVTASFKDFALLVDLMPPTSDVAMGTRPLAGPSGTTAAQ